MKGAAGNGKNAVRLPLFLTVAIHLGVFFLALAAPRLIPSKLQVPEVYQVELYTAPAAQPEPLPIPPQTPTVVEKPSLPDPPSPQAVPVKMQVKPVVSKPVLSPPAKLKAVSLSPIKERLARENRDREEQARRERQLNERVTMLKLDLQQQKAEEQAREAASQARQAIAETYRLAPTRPVQVAEEKNAKPRENMVALGGNPLPGASSPSSRELAAQAAYAALLREHLRRHWKLPVLQDWDARLSATMVIRIKRDGSVITTWFEKHSDNSRFDQYVKKAVDQSSPLPPLPKEFAQQSEEIAVTFTPGGLK